MSSVEVLVMSTDLSFQQFPSSVTRVMGCARPLQPSAIALATGGSAGGCASGSQFHDRDASCSVGTAGSVLGFGYGMGDACFVSSALGCALGPGGDGYLGGGGCAGGGFGGISSAKCLGSGGGGFGGISSAKPLGGGDGLFGSGGRGGGRAAPAGVQRLLRDVCDARAPADARERAVDELGRLAVGALCCF